MKSTIGFRPNFKKVYWPLRQLSHPAKFALVVEEQQHPPDPALRVDLSGSFLSVNYWDDPLKPLVLALMNKLSCHFQVRHQRNICY